MAGGGYPHDNAIDCSAQYGSYSWCINGRDLSARGFGYRNCTDFVAFRLGLTWGAFRFPSGVGHAKDWKDYAGNIGRSQSGTPHVGDIAWWGGTWGHVALVTAVAGDGSVTVEDYNKAGTGLWSSRSGERATVYLTTGGGGGGSNPGNAFGSIDRSLGMAGGGVFVAGWVVDPDTTGPIELHVYVDGGPGSGARSVSIGLARMYRPDVDAAHHKGAYHGFSTGFTGVPPGNHTLYFYGINAVGTPGDNPLIGQATINVPAAAAGSPFGCGDVANGDLGGVKLVGWAVDPDARTSPIEVHAYIDGPAGPEYRGFSLGMASATRRDVGAAYPGVGDNHGLDTTLGGLQPGPHSVFLYAINRAGGGENPVIGVLNFEVPTGSPVGALESATGGDQQITLKGWAVDPDDATGPVTIHAYVDGPAGQGSGRDLGPASAARSDVAAAHPAAGTTHGIETTIAVPAGRHGIWVYALDRRAPGENVLIGQKTVDVGSSPATSSAPAAAAGNAAAVVSWTPPGAGTATTEAYEVVGSPGGGSCSAGVGATSCTVQGLANGTTYTFRVRARNAVGWSGWSAASAGVTPVSPAPPPPSGGGTTGGSGGGATTGGGAVPVAAPGKATRGRVAYPAKGTAVLTWTAPANATSYQVRISKKNSTKKWNAWTTVTSPTLRAAKLRKGATYRVQITPTGPGGTGATGVWKFRQRK